jgi:FixJ family two-component response regulator
LDDRSAKDEIETHMPRVLLIEDDLVTLNTSALLLRVAGYDVLTATSGREGLDQAQIHACDVILADLSLGDMTAIDLLDGFRALGIDVPVVVITGLGTIDLAVKAMRRGAVDFAEKPLIGDELIDKVELGLAHGAARLDGGPPHAHAADRWASAVVALLGSRVDVRTTGQWARVVKVSASTLRAWCQQAGVGTRPSLVLARLLRAVHQSRHQPWYPLQRLSISDPRTLAKMLAAGGLPLQAERVLVRDFLDGQTLVHDRHALAALRAALARLDSTEGAP